MKYLKDEKVLDRKGNSVKIPLKDGIETEVTIGDAMYMLLDNFVPSMGNVVFYGDMRHCWKACDAIEKKENGLIVFEDADFNAVKPIVLASVAYNLLLSRHSPAIEEMLGKATDKKPEE